jgi:OFA family oxalate/formate antiporter-like MFS transporter
MNRWIRLAAAVVAMIMIANLQYAWTLFVKPLTSANGWKLSEVQWGFTLFIAFETWAMPFLGWMIDLVGPRLFMTVAGLLCGVGWAAMGQVQSLPALYAFYSMAGLGAALVYCGSTGVGLKWFQDKRGLAAGIIAAGFGSGAALFVPFISYAIRVASYRTAFLYTGIFQGLLIVAAAQFLRNPSPTHVPITARKVPSGKPLRRHTEDFNSIEMLLTPQFYVLYAMMLMMGIGGLMVTAQVAPVADSLGISKAILTAAVAIDAVANGSGRLFWGWASDYLGRERTMIVAFSLQGFSLLSVLTLGRRSGTAFIICLAMVFFTWGEIYSLFPSLSADFFGARHASSNYSFLYSSKGVASILGGGLAALLYEKTGTWNTAFYGSAVLAFLAALMACGLIAMPLPKKGKQLEKAPATIPEPSIE